MNEIERHLEVLLLDNDCVIVPGLGGFMAHPAPARYDESDGSWIPPMRTLGFNPMLRSGGSLLASSYSAAHDISYPDAVRRIDEEVGELLATLSAEGTLSLAGIGTLSLSEEGAMLFEPNEAGVLSPALYGLGAVSLPLLESLSPMRKSSEENDIQSTELVQTKSVASPLPAQPGSMPAWVYTAISAAAAVLMFFLISSPVSNGDGDIQFSSMAPHNVVTTGTKTVAKAAQSHRPAPTEKAKPQPTAPTKQTPAINQLPTKPYCIVLASHVTLRGATDLACQLKADGFDDAEVYRRGSTVRVVYGCYQSEDEARTALRQLRSNKNFEQGWIYKR